MVQLNNIDVKKSLGNTLKLKKISSKDQSKKRIKKFMVAKEKAASGKLPYSLTDFAEIVEKVDIGLADTQSSSDLTALVVEFNQAIKELVPSNLSETLFGVDEREPSDFEKSKFIRQYRVIEDPYHVLDLLEAGVLGGLEVETMAAFYPDTYQEIVNNVLEAVAASQSDDIPRSKTNALATLLMVPRLTPAILEVKDEEETPSRDVSGMSEASKSDVQKVTGR